MSLIDNALRANLSDEQLIANAIAAGWTWCDETTEWPGSAKYPAKGWREGVRSSFMHLPQEQKAEYLRGRLHKPKQYESLGFDHNFRCQECGEPIWFGWSHDAELLKKLECFTCNHWLAALARVSERTVIAQSRDGVSTLYSIGKNTKPSNYNGFGGDWFMIQFTDGRVIETCDLWCGGDIPERFRDRFAINAEIRHGRVQAAQSAKGQESQP